MFIPETIDLGESEKYILTIRIKADSFMFSISEPNVGKNYCLRETKFARQGLMLDNIKRLIFDYNFLTQRFLKTNVIYVSADYNIVPLQYHAEDKQNRLHDYIHTDKNKYVINYKDEVHQTVTLFEIKEELHSFLVRSLYKPQFYHHTNLLTRFFSDKDKLLNSSNKLFLNFHEGMLDIICFSESTFAHCTTFEGESTENQLYFILQLWNQLNLDQQTDLLFIFGQADPQLIGNLHEYIKNINNITTPSEVFLWNEDALKAPLDLLAITL